MNVKCRFGKPLKNIVQCGGGCLSRFSEYVLFRFKPCLPLFDPMAFVSARTAAVVEQNCIERDTYCILSRIEIEKPIYERLCGTIPAVSAFDYRRDGYE